MHVTPVCRVETRYRTQRIRLAPSARAARNRSSQAPKVAEPLASQPEPAQLVVLEHLVSTTFSMGVPKPVVAADRRAFAGHRADESARQAPPYAAGCGGASTGDDAGQQIDRIL